METFKKWFNLMWENSYIQIVIGALAFIGVMFYYKDEFETTLEFFLLMIIPVAVIAVVSCLGFYKFWKDNKAEL